MQILGPNGEIGGEATCHVGACKAYGSKGALKIGVGGGGWGMSPLNETLHIALMSDDKKRKFYVCVQSEDPLN